VLFLSIILGYLIGSIPIGYIFGKIKGIDVREVGFKRIGASNIYKTFGFIPGLLVFFSDFLKPICAILIINLIKDSILISGISGISAIIGHNWPIWLKFQGEGRGLASSLGFLYYFVPLETVIVFFILFLIGLKLKSSPLLTFIFFCILPFVVLFYEPVVLFWLCVGVSILAFIARTAGGRRRLRGAKNKCKILIEALLFDKSETT
jgi:glycerol-3-phosphate acyltransferase PlsY